MYFPVKNVKFSCNNRQIFLKKMVTFSYRTQSENPNIASEYEWEVSILIDNWPCSIDIFRYFIISILPITIFSIVSSMQNGQNRVGFTTGLPGFCNSTSRANFHRVGNTPLFKAMLKTVSSIPGLARCTTVRTLFGIPSGPGAILALARTWFTTASISSANNSGGPSLSSHCVTTSAGRCGNSWCMIVPTAFDSISSVMEGTINLFCHNFVQSSLRYVHTMPRSTQWQSAARPHGKSCAMPQVYVDIASAWLWHAVRCCAA